MGQKRTKVRPKPVLTDALLDSALTEVIEVNARKCVSNDHCGELQIKYNFFKKITAQNLDRMQTLDLKPDKSSNEEKELRRYKFQAQYNAARPNIHEYKPADHPEDTAAWRTFEQAFPSNSFKTFVYIDYENLYKSRFFDKCAAAKEFSNPDAAKNAFDSLANKEKYTNVVSIVLNLMYSSNTLHSSKHTPLGRMVARSPESPEDVCCIVYSKRNGCEYNRDHITTPYVDLGRGGMINMPRLCGALDHGMKHELDDMYMLAASLARLESQQNSRSNGGPDVFVLSGDKFAWALGACGWCPPLPTKNANGTDSRTVKVFDMSSKNAAVAAVSRDESIVGDVVLDLWSNRVRNKEMDPCTDAWAFAANERNKAYNRDAWGGAHPHSLMSVLVLASATTITLAAAIALA